MGLMEGGFALRDQIENQGVLSIKMDKY
jgi:hypothetical protein